MIQFKRNYSEGPIGEYYNGGGPYPDGFFVKRYFRQDEREPQPPIAELVLKRSEPSPVYQEANAGSACRKVPCEVLLPPDAPGDIMDAADLMQRFDATAPLAEDIAVEFKITLDETKPIHAAWEQVRAWAYQYFCLELSLAAVIVLHRPGLAGGLNPPHAHIFVPARKLTVNGFGAGARPFCTDTGNQLCFESWSAFSEAWRT